MTDFLELSELAARRKRPVTIGIAGGSGSGKTTLAAAFAQACGQAHCGLIAQDSFYIDQSARFDTDGGSVNFDDPQSLDFDLLGTRLQCLQTRQPTSIPAYDFTTHKRMPTETAFEARSILVVDGTLILNAPQVRRCLDIAIFVDTPETVRFARRLKRDTTQRGRTEAGVHAQFFGQVKPMHDLYVEPSRLQAHLTVSGQHNLQDSVAQVAALIHKRLAEEA